MLLYCISHFVSRCVWYSLKIASIVVLSSPVQPVQSCPVFSNPNESFPASSCPNLFPPVNVNFCQIIFCPIKSISVLSNLSSPIESYPVQFNPILSRKSNLAQFFLYNIMWTLEMNVFRCWLLQLRCAWLCWRLHLGSWKWLYM